jgi:3-hydroxyisobutyryl-CoA hydrolase
MRIGRNWSIAETFQREYDIASHFMAHPDFVEGVTSRLIERKKERPNWQPNTLEQVKRSEVDAFFASAVDGTRLPLISEVDYREYPHAWIGLPREEEILREVGGKKKEDVVAILLEKYEGKQGVREKIAEVFDRYKS